MGSMGQEGLLFPKTGKKKKRKKHGKSILHNRESGTCFLCMRLDDNYRKYSYLECHHIFEGRHNRADSEAWGLFIWLCAEHHRTGKNAVHGNNREIMELLKNIGKDAFIQEYPDQSFSEIFGKEYFGAFEYERDKGEV